MPAKSMNQNELKEVYRFRYVIFSFVQTNLKLRYRRSFLGFFWTMLAPMMHYLVMGVVFSFIVKSKMPHYFTFYFSGAVFFSIISGVMGRAPNMLITNEHYIKKIYLPKMIFVLNGVCLEIVNFLLAMSGLLILGLFFGKLELSWHVLTILIPIVLIAFFLLGLASIVSVLTVYFRDMTHIVPVIIQALFFLSPVVYDETMVPEKFQWALHLNPIYYYLDLFRAPLLEHRLAGPESYLIALGLSIASFTIGVWVFQKFDNKIVFKL